MRSLSTIFGVVTAAVVCGTPMLAQIDGLRFEVASINPHVDNGTNSSGYRDTPALVRMENLSLRALIRMGYGVRDAQLDAPGWTSDSAWDIVAKPTGGYDSRQLPELLRTLLADRFKLQVHRATKDVSGFALRTVAGGHRLPARTDRTFLTGRPGLISGHGRTIAELVGLLEQNVDAPVVDDTRLTGTFDLHLEWTPPATTSDDAGVPIFTALREQMGLRLDPIRTPAETIVVDSIAREPAPN